MKEYDVRISTIDDVKGFVTAMSRFDFDIEIVSGRYSVDAKSIMGIFSIDLAKDLKLVANTDDTAELEEAIEPYLIK